MTDESSNRERRKRSGPGLFLSGVLSAVSIAGLALAITTLWQDQQDDRVLAVTGWPYDQRPGGCGDDVLVAAAPGSPEPVYDRFSWDVNRLELIAEDGAGAYGQGRLSLFASARGNRQITIVTVTAEVEEIQNEAPWVFDPDGSCPPTLIDQLLVNLSDNETHIKGRDA